MMNKYYVYVHIRDGKIIYCGKGIKKVLNCGQIYDRAFEQGTRKYNVKDVEVKKIEYFDNEQEALYFEEKLTDYLKSIGQCEYNIDSGNKLGEKHRKKLSENHANFSGENNPMFGRTGEKHPMFGRTGENNPTSIKVIAYTDTGSYYQEFTGIRDAERELGVDGSHICKCCKGKLKSTGKITINGKKEKLRWRYKEDK